MLAPHYSWAQAPSSIFIGSKLFWYRLFSRFLWNLCGRFIIIHKSEWSWKNGKDPSELAEPRAHTNTQKSLIKYLYKLLEISFIRALPLIIMTIVCVSVCVLARSPKKNCAAKTARVRARKHTQTHFMWFMMHAQFFSVSIDELWWRDRDIRESNLSGVIFTDTISTEHRAQNIRIWIEK